MPRPKTLNSVGNFEGDSIPSIKEVYRGEYTYKPCPPNIGRYPIHPKVFMHSFLEPGNHTGCVAVQRLPKKLHCELTCAISVDAVPLPEGWGIYVVEGFNWGLIRLIVAVFVVLTLVLSVTWSIAIGDVQGGVGIGQYAVALVAVALTTVLLGQWAQL